MLLRGEIHDYSLLTDSCLLSSLFIASRCTWSVFDTKHDQHMMSQVISAGLITLPVHDHVINPALITWLIMHWSRGWSHMYHVTVHALIMWLSCTDHVAIMHWSCSYHALITWLITQWSRSYHVLVMWLIMHWSRNWFCTDHVALMHWSCGYHALIT